MSLRLYFHQLKLIFVVDESPNLESLVIARTAYSDFFNVIDNLAEDLQSFDAGRVTIGRAVRNSGNACVIALLEQ